MNQVPRSDMLFSQYKLKSVGGQPRLSMVGGGEAPGPRGSGWPGQWPLPREASRTVCFVREPLYCTLALGSPFDLCHVL